MRRTASELKTILILSPLVLIFPQIACAEVTPQVSLSLSLSPQAGSIESLSGVQTPMLSVAQVFQTTLVAMLKNAEREEASVGADEGLFSHLFAAPFETPDPATPILP